MIDRKSRRKPAKANKRKRQPVDWKSHTARVLRVLMLAGCGIMLVAALVLLVEALVNSDHFAVKQVEVNGNRRFSAAQVVALSDIRQGVGTFDLDLDIIGQKLAENDWIKSAQVWRKLPQTIVIDIVEHQPLFILNLDYLYYVDGDGDIFRVLRTGDKLDLPLVSGLSRKEILAEPQRCRQRLQTVAELLEELKRRRVFGLGQVAQVVIGDEGRLTMYTDPYGVAVLIGRDNFAARLDRLERIYPQLQGDLNRLSYIDLTVADKVIVKSVSKARKKG